jgi:hypothetical protein
MSRKTLFILVVILLILGGGALLINRTPTAPKAGIRAGQRLLPDTALTTIEQIVIAQRGTTTLLARVEGTWRVTNRDHFPADIDRLRNLMRAMDTAEIGQVMTDGTNYLDEFGLAAVQDDPPLHLTLHGADHTIALDLGKPRTGGPQAETWRPPQGRYARMDNGPVLLLSDNLHAAQASPEVWMDRMLLEVPVQDIRKVEVASPDGTYAIEQGTNNTFHWIEPDKMAGIEKVQARRLFSALQHLRFDRILTGEGQNSDPFTHAVKYTAFTADATYTVTVGTSTPEQPGRPVRISVTTDKDAPQDLQAKAAFTSMKVSNRVFTISAHLAGSLTMPLNELVPAVPKQEDAKTPGPENESERRIHG